MKIKIDENAFVPTRAHETDAGLDLYAREDQIVPAHGSAIFDTGVHVELPPFTVGDVDPKSGLFFKHNIFTHGTVDESYRGPIQVKLFNLGNEDYEVKRGDKIAQLVIKEIQRPPIQLVDELEDTTRGSGGFGSTGR